MKEIKKLYIGIKVLRGVKMEDKRKSSVILVNNGMVFDTIKSAASYVGVSQQCISQCCNYMIKSAGKLENGEKAIWRYKDEKLNAKVLKKMEDKKLKEKYDRLMAKKNDKIRKITKTFVLKNKNIYKLKEGEIDYILSIIEKIEGIDIKNYYDTLIDVRGNKIRKITKTFVLKNKMIYRITDSELERILKIIKRISK